MPFGIDVDMERCKSEVQETLETFTKTYIKSFQVALVEQVIADATEGKEDEEVKMELTPIPAPVPPNDEGEMKRQSSILKKWKTRWFWVNEKWELASGASADNKDKPEIINLWGYKVQGINFKPEGPRKGGPEWIPDEERPNCTLCNKAFSTIVWHHHCRACGEVFCSDCAGNKLALPHYGYEKPQRACNTCFEKLGGARQRAGSFQVAADKSSEEDTFHGIQLLHATRTPYVLQCNSLDEKKKWMEVLKECCKHAELPINSDPVLAKAFEAAHREASWNAGIWGWWRITGSEEEMISDVIAHNVYRTVVAPAIDGAPDKVPQKMKRMAENAINKQVQALIRGAVGPAWVAVADQVKKLRDELGEKIKPMCEEIAAKKQELSDKLKAEIMKVLDPILQKVGELVLDKVLPKITEPVIAAHTDSYGIVEEYVRKELAPSVKSSDDVARACQQARREFHYWWGVMRPVNEKLDDFRRDFSGVISSVSALSHISLSTVVGAVHDNLHKLMDSAFWTLENDESLKEGADEAKVLAAWKSVQSKLLHDSKLLVAGTFRQILRMALVPPVQDNLLQNEATKAALDPLDAMIPEAISGFISVSSLLEELLEDVCNQAVDKALEPGSNSTIQQLTEAHAAAIA